MTEIDYKEMYEKAEEKVKGLSWRIKYAADKLPVPSRVKSPLLYEEVKYVMNLLREIRETCNLDDIKPKAEEKKKHEIWIEEANWHSSGSVSGKPSLKDIPITADQIKEMWEFYQLIMDRINIGITKEQIPMGENHGAGPCFFWVNERKEILENKFDLSDPELVDFVKKYKEKDK